MQSAALVPPVIGRPGDPDYAVTGIDSRKLAIWAFLASEVLFFGALFSAYLLYRSRAPLGKAPQDFFDIPYTAVSSLVLLMSSLTMVLALAAVERGDHQRVRLWLLSTAMLGMVFLGGQVYEFTVFTDHGFNLSHSVAGSSFFLLTGLHGAHVAVGILWLLTLVGFSLRGLLTTDKSLHLELAGLYWGFVDVVWFVIFTVVYLLPSTQ
jgi:heme/copper-type cytochrome/quinol oxidase subunit 3